MLHCNNFESQHPRAPTHPAAFLIFGMPPVLRSAHMNAFVTISPVPAPHRNRDRRNRNERLNIWAFALRPKWLSAYGGKNRQFLTKYEIIMRPAHIGTETSPLQKAARPLYMQRTTNSSLSGQQ